MMPTASILVVDDELSIRLLLEETLTRDGHQVMAVGSGQEALALIENRAFDLALLDLKLGGMDGMDILAAMRQQSPDTVVIILTAHATLETAVEALRQGASDYLFKPCKTVHLSESVRKGLLDHQRKLRQRNLLHQLEQQLASELSDIRATIAGESAQLPSVKAEQSPEPLSTKAEPIKDQERFLQQGGMIVDLSRHVVTLNGYLLELSPTEFGLLAYLVSEAPRVISPQELVGEVHGYDSGVVEARDTVRQHIYHIRQKAQEATGRTDVIRTVRGVGYCIDP